MGDAEIVKISERVKKKHVPVLCWHPPKSTGQCLQLSLSIDPLVNKGRRHHLFGRQTCKEAPMLRFATSVSLDQNRCYSKKPWPGIGDRKVKLRSPLERDEKCLRHHVIGNSSAYPTERVAVHRDRMTRIDLGEQQRSSDSFADDLAIALHTTYWSLE